MVKDTHKVIDDVILPKGASQTKWGSLVPIKVNIFMWKVWSNRLPSEVNLLGRYINVTSLMCPICGIIVENFNHAFLCSEVAKAILIVKYGGTMV